MDNFLPSDEKMIHSLSSSRVVSFLTYKNGARKFHARGFRGVFAMKRFFIRKSTEVKIEYDISFEGEIRVSLIGNKKVISDLDPNESSITLNLERGFYMIKLGGKSKAIDVSIKVIK